MNIKNRISILLIIMSGISMNGQAKSQKQIEYEQNKVELFSVEERDNTQMWVLEQMEEMGLSEEQSNDYSVVLLYYLGKIRRLDDKDNFNSKEELIQKMDDLIIEQNKEVKEILTPEQYKQHLEFYGKMNLMRKNRIAETEF